MEEKKPIDIVKSVKTDLKKYRDQFKIKDDTEKAYYGEIWENDTKYKPVENHIFHIVENQVATMTDGMPGVIARTYDEAKKPQADNLSKAIEYINYSQNLIGQLPVVVRQSLIGFPSYIHEFYDAYANDGDGEIKREILHGKCVYLDGATPFIEGASKAYFYVNRQRDWLMLQYPKYKEKIQELKTTLNKTKNAKKIDYNNGGNLDDDFLLKALE